MSKYVTEAKWKVKRWKGEKVEGWKVRWSKGGKLERCKGGRRKGGKVAGEMVER